MHSEDDRIQRGLTQDIKIKAKMTRKLNKKMCVLSKLSLKIVMRGIGPMSISNTTFKYDISNVILQFLTCVYLGLSWAMLSKRIKRQFSE